jgi:peroxiredoxin Q/BCP
VKSHQKFKEKYHLPFNLLSDESHKVLEQYGVWGLKKMMGKEYMGIFRTTYLIAPDGTIKKVFANVKPDGHSQEVLAAL